MGEKKTFISRVKAWYRSFTHKDDPHYISGKEARRISRENRKTTREFEKKKRAKASVVEYTTQMRDPSNILEIDGLCTYFFTDAGISKAVDGVSFDIPKSSIVGVVGESGCGKSVTSLSVMQLVQAPQGQIVAGEIRFNTQDYKHDENGKNIPVWEYERDNDAESVNGEAPIKLDENGKPIIKTVQVTDRRGNPVCDKLGNPIMKRVQAVDGNGFPAFEMEDVVYNIAKMPTRAMQRIRGKEIAMIFQEPMTSLNPLFTIGNQLDEVVLLHTPGVNRALAKKRTIEMLQLVGIATPKIVYKCYPHELSGGMRQRVMIAMALACNPKLIVADEPTTALDVTIQAQVLDLLKEIKTKINGSIMIITHDLGVIAGMADYVVVMYAGRVIEKGTVEDIFDTPLHPYTVGLQKSKPVMNKDVEWLYSIKGQVPNPINMPTYCYFKDRCDDCEECCNGAYPPLVNVSPTHSVACYLAPKKMEEATRRAATKNATDKSQPVETAETPSESSCVDSGSSEKPSKAASKAKKPAAKKTVDDKSSASKPAAKKSAPQKASAPKKSGNKSSDKEKG